MYKVYYYGYFYYYGYSFQTLSNQTKNTNNFAPYLHFGAFIMMLHTAVSPIS